MNKFAKLLLVAAIALPLQFAAGQGSQIVINEVYGGGGNSGAAFNYDYVELFNNGSTAVDISGWSLQYASATGAFTNTIITFGAGTFLQAGEYFLIRAGTQNAAVGAPLPNVTHIGAGVNMSATAGKVRLINDIAIVQDLVGYGATANEFEGTAPAPAGSNTLSIQRVPDGFDSNNNNTDFQALAPTPVPEPSTYMLLGVGLLFAAQRFRRSRKS
jgi:uncharacterized protein